jgi:hypothetical protein
MCEQLLACVTDRVLFKIKHDWATRSGTRMT